MTWTATDECDNSSSVFVFLALADTIPPVILGVPEDTTVNCTDIPDLPNFVYATDECLCACIVVMQESKLSSSCMNGQVLLRTWTATDECGNETVATQRITLIDDQGPTILAVAPEIEGMTDGTIIEYGCRDNLPDYPGLLNAGSVVAIEECGSASVSFELTHQKSSNCELSGYLEQYTYRWTAVDDCGNQTSFTIFVRLIDNEAPVFVGVLDFACVGDPALQDYYAYDNCQGVDTYFWDVDIDNPCGTGTAILRIYEANDKCGNSSRDSVILMPDDGVAPPMKFANPMMNNHENGDVIVIDCASGRNQSTSFSAADVNMEDPCMEGGTVTFTERLLSAEDCVSEFLSVEELKWTATDVCGNVREFILIAHVIDESSPEFIDFAPNVTIGCNDPLPEIFATDNCGEVTITSIDSIVEGDCEFNYTVYREITATDPCGHSTTRLQRVQVGSAGPVITGVEEEICDDLSIPDVKAYDVCTGEYVDVEMKQDTLDVACHGGLVIRRSWTAEDICGNTTVVQQTIVMNDQTAPLILIPGNSFIEFILEEGIDQIHFSRTDLIKQLNQLNAFSVIVFDECNEHIIPDFTVDIVSGDCNEDGFSERRVYTWVATDICGNTASLTFSIDLIDDISPVAIQPPSDTTIICAPLPPAANVFPADTIEDISVTFEEKNERRERTERVYCHQNVDRHGFL